MLVDLRYGMHHCSVMLAPKLATNLWQRGFRELFGQVHGNLTGNDDLPRIILLLQLSHTHAERLGHSPLDGLDGDLADLGVDELLQALLGDRQRDLDTMHRTPGNEANQRTFQLTDVGAYVGCDEESDVCGKLSLLGLSFLLQNGDLGLKIRWLNVGNQAPLKTRTKTVFKVGQPLWEGDRKR